MVKYRNAFSAKKKRKEVKLRRFAAVLLLKMTEKSNCVGVNTIPTTPGYSSS